MFIELLLDEADSAGLDWPALVQTALVGVCEDDTVAETLACDLQALHLVRAEANPVIGQGDMVLAVLEEDGAWHPATVLEINEQESTAKVLFLAFGNTQSMSINSLRAALDSTDHGTTDLCERACVLCQREQKLTRHHLIPRMVHDRYLKKGFSRMVLNTTVDVCRGCHNVVHASADEPTLAARYFSIELLLTLEPIQKWIQFAGKTARQTKWDHARSKHSQVL